MQRSIALLPKVLLACACEGCEIPTGNVSCTLVQTLNCELHTPQKDKYDNQMTDYWGKFQVAQQDVVDAYSGNAEAGRVTGAG